MAEREWTGSVSVLPHSMREFANEMTNVARTVEDDPAALAATIPASTAARLAYAAKLQRDRARARSAMDRTAARLAAGLPA